ncbi:peptidase M48 Ste24p [Stanieria cyanosphaera PCC 7437]|uniref:Peptidase M48 Ste24p n=1 Tax=Stanieria cyanosphaera (strain ATCC 29371 / PCC 7437) TaxID=111780 RepID=K9XZS9_STAC7|nr:M48 family metallopeptidase [Stanieria cyanosphaera]AFZ37182.1 peptidase M48 Ste24p [Stanieria cyanosphaera PCC 7437]
MKLLTSLLTISLIVLSTSQTSFAQIINSPEITKKPSETESETNKTPNQSESETKQPTSEQIIRYLKLATADQLYLDGKKTAAEKLYREVKQPWEIEKNLTRQTKIAKPFYETEKLSPAGAVYWRTYQSGLKQNLVSKIVVPLQLLVEKQPEFIPGHIHYATALQKQAKTEEALKVLEAAISQYPNEPQLLRVKIAADLADKNWLDASITARQFALFNPQHPEAAEFTQLADQYLENFQSHLRGQLRENAIGSLITGAVGYALTGNLFGPISALETTIMLLRGESAVGESTAKQAQKYLPMVQDQEVLNYVRNVGQKVAAVSGRNEFDYEFYVVMDDQINAFALPGGKIFINAGTIMKTESEAELAGLLAHEIAHAVLSHGFQLVSRGSFTSNVVQYIPYVGGLTGNLIVLNYSRDMERQADTFGTKMLVNAGYAADGVRNLMVKLDQEVAKEKQPEPPAWLSTHPQSKDRISDLENLIIKNNLNRYAYEGVAKHQKISQKVAQLWHQYQQTEEYKERQREDEY